MGRMARPLEDTGFRTVYARNKVSFCIFTSYINVVNVCRVDINFIYIGRHLNYIGSHGRGPVLFVSPEHRIRGIYHAIGTRCGGIRN